MKKTLMIILKVIAVLFLLVGLVFHFITTIVKMVGWLIACYPTRASRIWDEFIYDFEL